MGLITFRLVQFMATLKLNLGNKSTAPLLARTAAILFFATVVAQDAHTQSALPTQAQIGGTRNTQIGSVGGNVIINQKPTQPSKSKWSGVWKGNIKYSDPEKRPSTSKTSSGLQVELVIVGQSITGKALHIFSSTAWSAPLTGTIRGQSITVEETIKFAPKYIKHVWLYKGQLNAKEETIQGEWKGDEDGDEGTFILNFIRP